MMEFDLIGDVGTDITGKKVSEMLQLANGEDVTFYVASLGGSLDDGITIHGLIKKYKGNTKGIIIGNTASAGTILILGCDSVECNSNAPFLIHNSIDPYGGNARELRKKAFQLDRHDKMMINIYKAKTGLPEEKISELMAKEDWLLPDEAAQYGFIDKVTEPYKAVAYYNVNNISQNLITKLEKKMNIFGKKEKQPAYILALKDGQLLANAEVVAEGVEVAPIGAMTLEDGSYELADGRKISVSGGVITEVKEMEEEPEAIADMDGVVEAVSEIVIGEIQKVEAKFNEQIEALKKVGSTHTPAKGKGPQAAIEVKSIHARVGEMTSKIRKNIEESRKS